MLAAAMTSEATSIDLMLFIVSILSRAICGVTGN